MTGAPAAAAFLGVCALAVIAAALLPRPAPPVWVSLAAAAALRTAFVAMTSRHYTPHDITIYFHSAGRLVLHGQDPLSHLPGRQWNFLELMPYLFALEIKSGLAWVYAAKIAPVMADVAVTALVYHLAGAGPDGRRRALQYAVNPVSMLVVSLHGQVEPVALALALGGVVAARRRSWIGAGLLLGAGVAAKTWPVFVLIAVLPLTRPRIAARLLAAAAVVPGLVLVSGVVFLDTHPLRAVQHIVSYTSLVDNWGWAGEIVASGRHGAAGYGTGIGHIGSLLVGVAAVATLVACRHRDAEDRALALLAAFLVVTAGFGNQYLLWPLPLLMARSGASRYPYVIAAGLWASVAYLTTAPVTVMAGLSWPVIAVLVWVYTEAVTGRRASPARRPEPSPPPGPMSPGHTGAAPACP